MADLSRDVVDWSSDLPRARAGGETESRHLKYRRTRLAASGRGCRELRATPSPHFGNQSRPTGGELSVRLAESLEEGALFDVDANDEPDGRDHDRRRQGQPVPQGDTDAHEGHDDRRVRRVADVSIRA